MANENVPLADAMLLARRVLFVLGEWNTTEREIGDATEEATVARRVMAQWLKFTTYAEAREMDTEILKAHRDG